MAQDIMMWVGEKHYPRIKDFVDEADVKGVCKRIGTVPDIEPGVSRCFLLHRDGGVQPRCFGWFVIEAICCMVTGAVIHELTEKYGPEVLYAGRTKFPEGERGCGEMRAGGLYIVSDKAWKGSIQDAKEYELHGGLNLFPYPFPKLWKGYSNFRGYSYIDGDQFMADMLAKAGC